MDRITALSALLVLLAAASCDCSGGALKPLTPRIEISPAPAAFGDVFVGFEETLAARIKNVGDAPLALETAAVNGTGFRLEGALVGVVEPGQEHILSLVFSPLAVGPAEGALLVASDAHNAPALSLPLSANGIAPLECEDLGPCTVGVFDPETGACGFLVLEGACDDGSGCTTAETCIEGRCVGEAIDCAEPPASCMVGLCGAEQGCTFLPVNEACDDGDPCTLDVCTAAGCSNDVAPDGTSCGATSCAAFHVCLSGQCEELATPDGFPCSDGDVCSSGDVCTAGVCAGDVVTSDGEVLGAAYTFGALGAVGLVLADGRLVVIDPHPYARGALVTVLERSSGALEVLGQGFEPSLQQRSNSLAATAGGGFAMLHDEGELVVFETGATSIAQVGSVDLWDAAAAYVKPALVSLGDGLLGACRAGDAALLIVSVDPPESPFVIATLALPAGCEHLAWDDKRGLVAATLVDHRFVRVDPFAAATDGVVIDELAGAHRFVATAEDLIAVGRVEDTFANLVDTISLYDANTLAEIASISPPLGGGVLPGVAAIALTDRSLFVLSNGPLTAWDLSAPESPSQTVVSLDDGGVHNASGARVFSTDGVTLIRSFSAGFWDRFHILDLSGDEPVELTHERRGAARTFARSGGKLYALHQAGIRRLDTQAPGSPAILEGTELMERRDAFWGLGAGGGAPLFPLSYRAEGMMSGSQPLTWLDGQDAGAVSVVGQANTPFLSGVLSVVSDGRYGYALRVSYDDAPFFDVYDLAANVPDADTGPPIALASLSLALAGAEVNNYVRVSLSGTRVVGVMQQDWSFDTPAAQLSSELLVVDVPEPSAPALAAAMSLSGLIRSARAHDDVVLAVRRTSGGWFNTDHEGEEVVRLVISDDGINLDTTLALPESGEVLWLDEARAVVSTKDGVAFLEHGPGSLSLRSSLSLAEPPTAATFVAEALWLVGEHGVIAVQPPCP